MRKLLAASLALLALACGEDISPVKNSSCSLKRVSAMEKPDDSDQKSVNYAIFPSEDIFDNEGDYWGTILPRREPITFRNVTPPLPELDDGDYEWKVDGVVKRKGSLDRDSKELIPSLDHIFDKEGWHSTQLSVNQVEYVDSSTDSVTINAYGGFILGYFSVVPRINGNYSPVPIVDPNYPFHAGFQELYGEGSDAIIPKPLASVRVGETVNVPFQWSYDLESFGQGEDCNGIDTYSVCVSKQGEECHNPQVSNNGEFKLTVPEPGKYDLTLTVADFDGYKTSTINSFEVKE